MLDAVSLTVVLLIIIGLLLLFGRLKAVPKGRLPPGPRGLPIIGSLLDLQPIEHLTFCRWRRQYGDILTFKAGFKRFLLLNSYQAVKEAFLGQPDVFAGRSDSKYLRELCHHSGIIFIDGPVWQEQRRYVLRVLRDFGFGRTVSEDIINSEVDVFLKQLETMGPFEVRPIFAASINNVIARLTFGERSGADDPAFPQLLKHIEVLTNRITFASLLPVILPFINSIPPLLTFVESLTPFRAAIEFVHVLIRSKVNEHKAVLGSDLAEMDLSQANDVCDALLIEQARMEREKPNEHTFTDWQVLRNCMELFLAGTDTTATTLSWAMFFMSTNPDFQKRVQAELDAEVGQARRPTMKDRVQLHLVNAVIDEILRKSSTNRSGLPHRVMCDTELMGYHIPEGMMVIPNLYGIHHDPELWKNPEAFWPEHFLDDNDQYRPSSYLHPFSMGRRACLGESLARMEVFLYFTAILQSYNVRLADPNADVAAIAVGTRGQIRRPLPHQIVFEKRADE